MLIAALGYGRGKLNKMIWIELIRVRSSAAVIREAEDSLYERILELRKSADGVEIYLLRHQVYEGDLSVQFVWKNLREPRATREGHLLGETLSKLGPVEHAVWIPAVPDSANGEASHESENSKWSGGGHDTHFIPGL